MGKGGNAVGGGRGARRLGGSAARDLAVETQRAAQLGGSRATMALRMPEGAGSGVSGDLFDSTPFTSADRGERACAH